MLPQMVKLLTGFMVGMGITLIEKVLLLPLQLLLIAETVISAVVAAKTVLDGVKAGIFPLPLDANPMEGVLLFQVIVALGTLLVRLMGADNIPWQRLTSLGCAISGAGFTLIRKLVGIP